MPSSKLSVYCDRVIEAGWLAAVIAAPLFFNVYSSRVFEPDKLTLVRSIASVMIVAWLIKWIEQRRQPRSETALTWRTALVLPNLILAGVYLLTTLTSITPRVSFFGSYQRLQGTYTTLSYIVIFFMLLQGLRTRAQLERLVMTIVLTSLPIALYGLIQRSKLDTLPWGGDVTARVASNMGNPIFVAAYLIMAFFLTLGKIAESFRAILAEEEAVWADVVRAAGYVFIAAVQLVAISFAGSRGPYIGFLTGFFVFGLVFLIDLRWQAEDKSHMTPAAFGAAILAALGVYVIPGLVGVVFNFLTAAAFPKASWGGTLALVAAIIALLVVGIWLLSNRKTWKWLWLTWVTAAIIAAGILGAANVMPQSPLFAPLRNDPNFGRLANLIETEGGSGKVRTLIWEGNTQLVPPHEPIRFPDGSPDPLNVIRPLIGYGPEAMYVAYNRFYPPDLAHYESRNASPDRSHNETWDALVITGVLGLLAYQFLFISFFIYGFRQVGLMPTALSRNLFIGLWVGLGILGGVAAIVLGQPKYFGMGVPGGILAAIILYLIIFSAFLYKGESSLALRPEHRILVAALLAGVVAHYIEIHFGIAIASTRTLFWAFAGVLVVVGSGWIAHEEPEQSPASAAVAETPRTPSPMNVPRHKRRKAAARPITAPEPQVTRPVVPAWVGSMSGYALIGAMILSTLFYEFITNSERLGDPVRILWRALTYNSLRNMSSYAVLGMFALTWLLIVALAVSEMSRAGVFNKPGDWTAGMALFASLSLGIALIFALGLSSILAGLTRLQAMRVDDMVGVADQVAGVLNYYYGLVFLVVLVAALLLTAERGRLPSAWAAKGGWGAIAVLPAAILVFFWINYSNLNPIRADIVYKQADPWDRQGQWDVSVAHYKHALDLAPNEDFYYLWLGRAYLEKAKNANATAAPLFNDKTQLEGILSLNAQQTAALGRNDLLFAARSVLTRARELNPLNTDHSANLARLLRTWGDLESDAAKKQKSYEQSGQYYAQATSLSPHNAILWNEWATVELSRGNVDEALKKLDDSIELDTQFDQTYLILGDIYLNQKNWDKAAEAYQKVVALRPDYAQAQGMLAYVYAQQGKLPEAIQANLKLLDLTPTDPNRWNTNKNLALLYQQMGDLNSAINQAQIAATIAPTNDRLTLQNYAAQLRAQLAAPPAASTTPVTKTP